MSDMTQDFDGPIVEPVNGIGDVNFARADMGYWSQWASALKTKRVTQFKAEIDKMPTLTPLQKAQAIAGAQNAPVQLFEVLDQQFTPDGVSKILREAFERAGGEPVKWPGIVKRIGPQRQQQLASEICSEPKPTSAELRQSLRDVLRKAKKTLAGIDTMSDEELITAAREYQNEPEQPGPLAGSPSDESNSTAETSSDSAGG